MKALCISHIKDVDGLGSAAIVRAATGASVRLSDYNELNENLKHIPRGIDHLVICDLGTDAASSGEFVELLRSVASRARVTYVDHHYLAPPARRELAAAGVELVHNVEECSSVLAYNRFAELLPDRAKLIALCGAVTDYMDGSPKASKLMEQMDRQFVLLEATLLAFALGKRGGESDFRDRVVKELAKMVPPHEIPGVADYALLQLADAVRLGEEVRKKGKKRGRLAYMVTSQRSTGNVAKLLIGAFGVPVGIALKEQQGGWYEVSLRSTSECRVHLGKTIGEIASRLGGTGGGHAKAAGCRIPVSRADRLLVQVGKVV